jgi:class 3 adenylate cyclase
MALRDDLETEVAKIFGTAWRIAYAEKVPEDKDVGLGNDAKKLSAAVLYADLRDSTDLVNRYEKTFAAEIYKTFLYCAAKIIADNYGVVTAYDGDRVMAVFFGTDWKETYAARAALKINWTAKKLITDAKKKQYPNGDYTLRHVVGVDTSELLVARTGVRGANDLVWVGRAANWAAKLATLEDYPTYITAAVYDNLDKSARFGDDGRDMWTELRWKTYNNERIYGSDWWWEL